MLLQERYELLNQISKNTIDFRLKQWIDNFTTNLKHVQGGYGVSSMQNVLKNVPCIIVGSGPTLDRNIKYLREVRNRACIISCDSTVKALLDHGVKPHLILSTDSKGKVKEFFSGLDVKEFSFILDTFSHPSCCEALEGAKIYWYNTLPVEYCPFTAHLNNWTGYIGNIGTGGCVATTIWCFGVQNLGCDPDILVGLTQGFYDVAYQYAWSVMKHADQIIDQYTSPPIEAIDIYNQHCWTHPAFNSFAFWFYDAFLHVPGIHINCSEGGILREHILNMRLSEVLERYLKTEYDIMGMLYQKENLVDHIINQIGWDKDSDIYKGLQKYRPAMVTLLDGPSLPNLALRLGVELDQVTKMIAELRTYGLNITDLTNNVEVEPGIFEAVPVFRLDGVLKKEVKIDTGCDLREEKQSGISEQAPCNIQEPSADISKDTAGTEIKNAE